MELLLNLCIYLPLVGILGILISRNDTAVKWISLVATMATFLLSLPLLFNFDVANSAVMQYATEGDQILPGLDVKFLGFGEETPFRLLLYAIAAADSFDGCICFP